MIQVVWIYIYIIQYLRMSSTPVFKSVVDSIPIMYSTNYTNVSCTICVGKGKDAHIYPNKEERTNFKEKYPLCALDAKKS